MWRWAVLWSGAGAPTNTPIFGEALGDRNWHDYAFAGRIRVALRDFAAGGAFCAAFERVGRGTVRRMRTLRGTG